jgi:hypothetical protein
MTDDLNPDIKEITYGKRNLKTITIYPLSIGDQFKVTDLITELIKKLGEAQAMGANNDFALVTAAIKILEDNITKILSLVADASDEECEDIVNNMTNTQLMEVVDIVWSVNFEPAIKKGKSLFEKGKSIFNSPNLSPDSSDSSLSTGSRISTEGVIKAEE